MSLKQTTLAESSAVRERAPALLAAVGVAPSLLVDEPAVWPVGTIVQRLSTAMQEHFQTPLETVLIKLRAARASLLFGHGPVEPPAADRGNVRMKTLLTTDLEGFTPMVERIGDERGQRLIHTHNALLRACLKRHGGREAAHTGDGLIASFTAANQALRCAMAIQRCLREHNRQHPLTPLKVRIGLHAGVPLPEENRLFGTCVNVATRVCACALAERILVSETVLGLIDTTEFELIDRGDHVLKGVTAPLRLHELKWRRSAELARIGPERAPALN